MSGKLNGANGYSLPAEESTPADENYLKPNTGSRLNTLVDNERVLQPGESFFKILQEPSRPKVPNAISKKILPLSQPDVIYHCGACSREYKTKSGRTRHQNLCEAKRRNQEIEQRKNEAIPVDQRPTAADASASDVTTSTSMPPVQNNQVTEPEPPSRQPNMI